MEKEAVIRVKGKNVPLSNWRFVDPVYDRNMDSFLSDKTKKDYIKMIFSANGSKPTPSQSDYYVRTSGKTKSGIVVTGSNHEMAITDTVTHGEESVIDHALEKAGEDDLLEIIAFSGKEGGGPISCCGNCRDAIQEYCPDDLVLLSGSVKGGAVSVMNARDLFHGDFRRGNDIRGFAEQYKYIDQAFYAASSSYDIYADKKKASMYGAVIVSDCKAFKGSFFGDVSYHPILPIGAAICNFRDSTMDAMRLQRVSEIVIVTFGCPADIPYKDRQHALEFSQSIAAYSGKEDWAIPIRIFKTDRAGNFEDSRVTNTREWLPFPFSPKHLGKDQEMKAGIAKFLMP
jgi:cytidine deaminase